VFNSHPDNKRKCPDNINFGSYQNPYEKIFELENSDNAEKHKNDSGKNYDIASNFQLFRSLYSSDQKTGNKNYTNESHKDVNKGKIQQVRRIMKRGKNNNDDNDFC